MTDNTSSSTEELGETSRETTPPAEESPSPDDELQESGNDSTAEVALNPPESEEAAAPIEEGSSDEEITPTSEHIDDAEEVQEEQTEESNVPEENDEGEVEETEDVLTKEEDVTEAVEADDEQETEAVEADDEETEAVNAEEEAEETSETDEEPLDETDGDTEETDEVDDEVSAAEEETDEVDDEVSAAEEETTDEPAEEEDTKKWYVVKVQSGREESIKEAIERRVKIEGLEEYYGEVLIPVEKEIVKVKGKRRERERKKFPGYIMARVEYNDQILYLFRETSGVGDFVGGGINHPPQPMSDFEVKQMMGDKDDKPVGAGSDVKEISPYSMGDRVQIKDGVFSGMEGEVTALMEEKGQIRVETQVLGRPVKVELEYWQVEGV